MRIVYSPTSEEAMNTKKPANKAAAAHRRYVGQLDDFMKFDCHNSVLESRSAAVPELWTLGA